MTTLLISGSLALDELERFLARRDRPRGALLGDELEQPADLRPRRDAELVATEQRLRRLVLARRPHGVLELGRPDEHERVVGPRLRRPAEPVDRARRAVRGPLRVQKLVRVPLRLVRHREAPQALAEDRDEAKRGPVDQRTIEPRARPSERRQQAELVGPPVTLDREPDELGERPLPRRFRDERRLVAHEPFRLQLEHEAELVLEPHGAQQAQRIVREHGRRDRADQLRIEVRAPAVRVDRFAAGERARRSR